MSIFPLPVFEADADPHHRTALSDAEIYARLEPPKTIVVKFGFMKLVGEFSYDGDAKPGCGSKLIARTIRGTEVVEMLTTTCANSGCSKSVSRQEMLDYIENSGGRDFPFHTKGRILRVATIEDLNKQAALQTQKTEHIKFARDQIAELKLPMKLVDVEPILGGELLTFYYMSEDRIDFRELVTRLSSQYKTRIEMRQVGARDEARLVADYERCGQHCCCKNFLKVLKPISMRSAKVQKATLDPLKISGRCGRLMCCLRYEDQTYSELKKNLPPRNKRVGTSEGPGLVIDTKILVQLVLVRLEHDMKEIAVPVEELMDPDNCPKPRETTKYGDPIEYQGKQPDPLRGMPAERVRDRVERSGPQQRRDGGARPSGGARPEGGGARPDGGATQPPPADGSAPEQGGRRSRRKRRRDRERNRGQGQASGQGPDQNQPQGRSPQQQQDAFREKSQALEHGESIDDQGADQSTDQAGDALPNAGPVDSSTGIDSGAASPPAQGGPPQPGGPHRKRRRRRRRRRGGGSGGADGSGGGGGGGDAGGGGGSAPQS